MSLKAKIEAVIYASEEPVTSAQLMGLLGEEAQLELDAREAAQSSLALEMEETADGGDPEALNEEALSGTAEESPVEAEAVSPTHDGDETAVMNEAPAPSEEASGEEPPSEAAAVEQDAKAVAAEARARERKLRAFFRETLDELIADYANGDRGLEVREVAGGFRLATKPEYHDAVRGFVKQLKPPLKLSLQALETLAVVAYKQPVTAPEVAEIRGVDSGGVLGSLITRKLVQTAGRKQVIGRPMLYKTSKEFLVRFGLKDINELPSIEEFEKMAGELNEAVQEEIPMDEAMPVENSQGDASAEAEEGSPAADESPVSADAAAEPTGSAADDFLVDGRVVGIASAERDDPEVDLPDSAELDAEIQSEGEAE